MAKGRTCTVALPSGNICPRKHKAFGWCQAHYQRWQTKGDVLAEISFRRYRKEGCAIPGCPRRHYAREWCRGHWEAWHRHGDPNVKLRAPKGQADFLHEGYHYIHVDGRIVPEHRWLMEKQLGRALLPGENVHHMNGGRADNRLENLELWVTKQPKGQRVADLVAFVVERYPEQVARMLRAQRRGAKPTEHPTLW